MVFFLLSLFVVCIENIKLHILALLSPTLSTLLSHVPCPLISPLPSLSCLPRHIKITFSTLLVQLLRALHQVLLLWQHVLFKLIALKHN